jgi:amino acid transporter
MKALLVIGVIVLILGILSFFVGVPHSENHGVSVGGASVGVQTHHTDRIPVAGSIALVLGGIVLVFIGARDK